jgi:hypothetical protein
MSNNNTPSPDQRLTPPIKDNNTPTNPNDDRLIMIYRISYIILLILAFLYPKLSKNIIYKIILGIDLIIVSIPIAILIFSTLCVFSCISCIFTFSKNDQNSLSEVSSITSTILLFQFIIIIVGLGAPILTYLFSKNIVFPNIDSVSNSTSLSTTDSASSS